MAVIGLIFSYRVEQLVVRRFSDKLAIAISTNWSPEQT